MQDLRNVIWDETSVDVAAEANFIWSIANKLRGSYMPDKYGDVIIPMVIIRRFECTLEKTKRAVLDTYKKNPLHPYKAIFHPPGSPSRISPMYSREDLSA